MGAWGTTPWDNDKAADWFADTMDTTGLPERVGQTLGLDVNKHHEEVRAAAYLLIALGHSHIWPIKRLDAHLRVAIRKLGEIRNMEIYSDSAKFTVAIQAEIDELYSRLTR